MTSQARTLIVYANFLVAAGIGAGSLYLILMPLYPLAGDSHGGLLATFAGLFLAPVALSVFAAGRMFQKQYKRAWIMQLLALVLVVPLALSLVL